MQRQAFNLSSLATKSSARIGGDKDRAETSASITHAIRQFMGGVSISSPSHQYGGVVKSHVQGNGRILICQVLGSCFNISKRHRTVEPQRNISKKMKSSFFVNFRAPIPVNQPVAHAALIATYRRAEAEAAHKFGLIKTVATKSPNAIQAAVETAAKVAKRRDSYAGKLAELG